jgi:hypothetical protein
MVLTRASFFHTVSLLFNALGSVAQKLLHALRKNVFG